MTGKLIQDYQEIIVKMIVSALKIVFDIIDREENGLGIGNMTSQIFAMASV